MNLLLDAQALIWAVDDPSRLGPTAAVALRDSANELAVSAGTAWEIAIKIGLGKLTLSMPFGEWMTRATAELAASLLPITIGHPDEQSRLPLVHRDPFDRLLIAQARVEGLTIVSSDTALDAYGIARVWQ